MVIGSHMKGAAQEKFRAAMEAQGAKVRKTKNGLMVYAPDGATLTVHTTNGDHRSLKNDVAWFRRHGLTHPSDNSPHRQETEDMGRKAETNDEGYPHYMVGPINGTTRKRVLSELESKGWPLRVHATELDMDTVTAQRALYAVGYRWDPESPARRRVWVAPDDIKEMHEKVKAEMRRREEEARAQRQAAQATVIVEPGAIVITGDADPEETARHAVKAIQRDMEDRGIPTPKEVMDAIEEGRGEEIAVPFKNPGKTIGEAATPEFLAEHAPASTKWGLRLVGDVPSLAPQPEREFIDSVDSWTVTEADAPVAVHEYLRGLRAAGLEVEIRVWRQS